VTETETETVTESETVTGFTWSRWSSRTPDTGPRTPAPGPGRTRTRSRSRWRPRTRIRTRAGWNPWRVYRRSLFQGISRACVSRVPGLPFAGL